MRGLIPPYEFCISILNYKIELTIIKKGVKCMSKKSRDIKDFWIFVGPALFAMTMVVIIPFIIGIYYTFTNWKWC